MGSATGDQECEESYSDARVSRPCTALQKGAMEGVSMRGLVVALVAMVGLVQGTGAIADDEWSGNVHTLTPLHI